MLSTGGSPFTEESIGGAVATHTILAELLGAGEITGGQSALSKGNRSRFPQQLDETTQAIRWRRRGAGS